MRGLRCAAAGDRTDSVMAGNTRHIPLVTIAWMFFRALSIGEFKTSPMDSFSATTWTRAVITPAFRRINEGKSP
jgi:hypothetical protein